jgi:hypothetical protein
MEAYRILIMDAPDTVFAGYPAGQKSHIPDVRPTIFSVK